MVYAVAAVIVVLVAIALRDVVAGRRRRREQKQDAEDRAHGRMTQRTLKRLQGHYLRNFAGNPDL